jgi:hypothetical protein
MAIRWNKLAQRSAIGAVSSLALWIGTSNAKDDEGSVLVKKPAVAAAEQGPVLPPPSKPANDIFTPQTPPPQKSQPPLPPQTQQQPPAPQLQPAGPRESQVKRPFMRPAVPREPAQGKLTAEQLPPPAGQVVVPPNGNDMSMRVEKLEYDVRPTPPIVYDTDHDARKMYRATGEIRLVMVTQNPADGCYYEIPLCIPGCCVGDPIVKGGRGIFGRGVTEYCWPCGFRAIVKFRQILGDVRVDYEGD